MAESALLAVTVVLRLQSAPDGLPVSYTYGPNAEGAWTPGEACWNPVQRQWEFTAELLAPDQDLEFVFRVGDVWQEQPNLRVERGDLIPGGTYVVDDRSVRFATRAWFAIENPTPARLIFTPRTPLRDDDEFDLIVIGSGAGGGTLAYEAAGRARQRRVLVLEAGSYLFPVHVQNLARRELAGPSGTPPKGIFELFYPFARDISNEATLPAGHQSALRLASYLGGQTLFWGALAPEPRPWELADWWPESVRDQLRDGYLGEAENLLGVCRPESEYTSRVIEKLGGVMALNSHVHEAAPLATEFRSGKGDVLPLGTFSTADLLIEQRLLLDQNGDAAFPRLEVLLNHRVSRLVLDGQRATSVVADDLVAGRPRTFRVAAGGSVVLAAGAMCTPLLADRSGSGATSGLPNASGLRGYGLTDHPVCYADFQLPATSDLCRPDQCSITLSRPRRLRRGGRPAFPFNVKLMLNTWLAQNRMSVGLPSHPTGDGTQAHCQIVFLAAAPLQDANFVREGPQGWPVASVSPVPADELRDLARTYAEAVVAAVGGHGLSQIEWAPIGGVSHQVGTMRMSEDPGKGVVDPDLRVWGTDNVYVCDLSVFPTSPASNPTLTLAALAIRLADHLAA